jgi:nitrous oxidase accessory protein NosD
MPEAPADDASPAPASAGAASGAPRWAKVFLHGFDSGALTALQLGVADVRVRADGVPVYADVYPRVVDLTNPFEDAKVARFEVPPGARRIAIEVLFDDDGKLVLAYGRTGVVDARGAPMSAEVDGDALAAVGKLVFHIDAVRSLAEADPHAPAYPDPPAYPEAQETSDDGPLPDFVLLPNFVVRSGNLHQLRTLVVDDDRVQCPYAQFTTIQDAVDAAFEGEKIKVCPGLYAEAVSVGSPLFLQGSGPEVGQRQGDPTRESVVQPPPGAPAFGLGWNHAVVLGFTIEGGPSYPGTSTAGVLTSPLSSGYVIRKNLLRGLTAGVMLLSSAEKKTQVRDNLVQQNQTGVLVLGVDPDFAAAIAQGAAGVGEIQDQATSAGADADAAAADPGDAPPTTGDMETLAHRWRRSAAVIARNEVLENDTGVLLAISTDVAVEGNQIRRNRNGLVSVVTIGLHVGDNDVKENENGMVLALQFESEFVRNDASGNSENGILVVLARENRFAGNRTSENGKFGLLLAAATENQVEHGDAVLNGVDGIRVTGGSVGNALEANRASGNGEHDAHDDDRDANEWTDNRCVTDFPEGTLCGGP